MGFSRADRRCFRGVTTPPSADIPCMRNKPMQARQCYGCGFTIADSQAVLSVDLASASGWSFSEPVSMHEQCARAYVPVDYRNRRSHIDVDTRRGLARDLRQHGRTLRAIARTLDVSPRTIAKDLAG
jgi:hypothetical protein